MSRPIGGRHVAIRSEEPAVTGPRHGREPQRSARPAGRVALVAGLSTATVLAGGGVAFAYWSTGGDGSGSTTVGTVSLSAAPVTAAGLYPGATTPVTVVVAASGDGTVQVTGITPGTTEVSSVVEICNPASVTFTVTGVLPQSVTAGTPVEVTGEVAMSLDAEDGCQGRTFTIPLTVEGRLP